MSASVSYAIKSGGSAAAKTTKYSQISEKETTIKKARDLGSVSFGFLFSILYVGTGANFYFNLTRVEEITRTDCTGIYNATLEKNLDNFCEHLITWKSCAIMGVVVPGLLYMVLGLLTLWEISRKQKEGVSDSSGKTTCQNLWNTYDFLSKVVTIAITCVLLSTKAHSTMIGNSSGLRTAAIIYLVVVGAELASIVLIVVVGLAFGLCACSVLFCGMCCCWGCTGSKSQGNTAEKDDKEHKDENEEKNEKDEADEQNKKDEKATPENGKTKELATA